MKRAIMTIELDVQVPDDTDLSSLCLGNTNKDFIVESVDKNQGELGAQVLGYETVAVRDNK